MSTHQSSSHSTVDSVIDDFYRASCPADVFVSESAAKEAKFERSNEQHNLKSSNTRETSSSTEGLDYYASEHSNPSWSVECSDTTSDSSEYDGSFEVSPYVCDFQEELNRHPHFLNANREARSAEEKQGEQIRLGITFVITRSTAAVYALFNGSRNVHTTSSGVGGRSESITEEEANGALGLQVLSTASRSHTPKRLSVVMFPSVRSPKVNKRISPKNKRRNFPTQPSPRRFAHIATFLEATLLAVRNYHKSCVATVIGTFITNHLIPRLQLFGRRALLVLSVIIFISAVGIARLLRRGSSRLRAQHSSKAVVPWRHVYDFVYANTFPPLEDDDSCSSCDRASCRGYGSDNCYINSIEAMIFSDWPVMVGALWQGVLSSAPVPTDWAHFRVDANKISHTQIMFNADCGDLMESAAPIPDDDQSLDDHSEDQEQCGAETIDEIEVKFDIPMLHCHQGNRSRGQSELAAPEPAEHCLPNGMKRIQLLNPLISVLDTSVIPKMERFIERDSTLGKKYQRILQWKLRLFNMHFKLQALITRFPVRPFTDYNPSQFNHCGISIARRGFGPYECHSRPYAVCRVSTVYATTICALPNVSDELKRLENISGGQRESILVAEFENLILNAKRFVVDATIVSISEVPLLSAAVAQLALTYIHEALHTIRRHQKDVSSYLVRSIYSTIAEVLPRALEVLDITLPTNCIEELQAHYRSALERGPSGHHQDNAATALTTYSTNRRPNRVKWSHGQRQSDICSVSSTSDLLHTLDTQLATE